MTKIYYGRRLMGKFTCDGRKYTRFQILKMKIARGLRNLIVVSGIGSATLWTIFGAFQFGKIAADPQIVRAEVVKEVQVLNSPVLARIAKCESGGNQYDKTGQVLIKINTNDTVDIGKFQINSVWKTQATKLGFDLTKEKDNESFAEWLYLNIGTQPWYSSIKCWNK